MIDTKRAEIEMKIRYGNLSDATMLSELGAKTFYDTFARDNTPENISLYIKKSFSREIQLNELSRPDMNSKEESVKGEKVMEIERIYASQEYIGKGVGKELMKACINEARQRNCDSVWLGVWESNQRAIDF